MDYLSSMYIDNEMDLNEKRHFVEKIRTDPAFADETLDLLDQERLLRSLPAAPAVPAAAVVQPRHWRLPFRIRMIRMVKPLGFASAGFAAALLMFLTLLHQPAPVPAPAACSSRFVLFAPSVGRVELAGSFTGWQRVAMQRAGNTGYWELSLPVPPGEYRFSYILDGRRQVADPTLPASEKDDFGGENSILTVGTRA